MTPDWLTRRFADLVAELDLPPVWLRDLRHLAASIAGAAGVDLKVIQHAMGHSSPVTTAEAYRIVFQQTAQSGRPGLSPPAAVPRPHPHVPGCRLASLSTQGIPRGDHGAPRLL